MHLCKKITLCLFTFSLISLTGCQTPQLSKEKLSLQKTNQFNLQGKIGVKTPEQSGSAFFTWEQDQAHFDIDLSGALGIGRTQIEGKIGQEAQLNNSKTGLIKAQTPEELLQKATGWQAPITYLIDWIQARPATLDAQIERDELNRIHKIQEAGWQVELFYTETNVLPRKLIIQQKLPNEQENRITMVIQNR